MKRLGALGFTAILGLASGCSEAPPPGPPVILITVDGLIGDGLSVFGGPEATPALQQIADGGGAWADGWTVSPMTRPAAATYLTGLAPDRHEIRDDLFAALPEGVPTLAGLLAQRGYRTAALPDTSFLALGSGLLREFEVVDDPPAIPTDSSRWLPVSRIGSQTALHARTWLESVPAGEPYFAWVHFSEPLVGQLQGAYGLREVAAPEGPDSAAPGEPAEGKLGSKKRTGLGGKKIPLKVPRPADATSDGVQDRVGPKGYEEAVARFDAAVGELLGALRERGDLERALVVVAGTQGDIRAGEDEMAEGSGFSLGERAVRVPVIVKFPAGTKPPRAGERPVWAPDVPRTIAELTGVGLSDEAEGVSLLAEAAEDRVLFSWSWAPLDQMGWKPLRAARSGEIRRIEGQVARTSRLESTEPVPHEQEQRLARALGERGNPAAPAVDLESVRQLLEARGLELAPVPAGGREFGPPERQGRVVGLIWRARFMVREGRWQPAGARFQQVIQLDPQNLAAHLDLGQMMAMNGRPAAIDLLGAAAELYPANPEVLHWLAHALWSGSREEAVELLMAIRSLKLNDPDVLYDLACASSLDGELDAAEEYLRGSIAAGYRQWDWMEADPDLRNLKESGRFAEVVGEYR